MAHQIGDTIAAFTLPRGEGGELTVDPSTTPATVVVFTANHCPYALAWHGRIQQVARDYADRGVLAGRPVALAETEPRGCTIKWRSAAGS